MKTCDTCTLFRRWVNQDEGMCNQTKEDAKKTDKACYWYTEKENIYENETN